MDRLNSLDKFIRFSYGDPLYRVSDWERIPKIITYKFGAIYWDLMTVITSDGGPINLNKNDIKKGIYINFSAAQERLIEVLEEKRLEAIKLVKDIEEEQKKFIEKVEII